MASACAIDRPIGHFTVNSNGSALYNLPIEVPPGIGNGNEPDLCFQYMQGVPNGPLGPGWIIGGLSSIQRSTPALATEYANQPAIYDPSLPRLALDGQELLNTSGDYWAAGTTYSPELNPSKRSVTLSTTGQGYIVTDSAGRTLEYGTTADSVAFSADGTTELQWYLKRSIDVHGNSIAYNYTTIPSVKGSTFASGSSNPGMCFIDNICYTSNENGLQGCRYVFFQYAVREDSVVRSQFGGYSICDYLLSSVIISVVSNGVRTDIRSYELSYSPSQVTDVSCLTAITEKSCGADSVVLTPTVFTYTGQPVAEENLFSAEEAVEIFVKSDAVSLIPMDISGRGLTEFACVTWNSGGIYSLQAFNAEPTVVGNQIKFDWKASKRTTGLLPVRDSASGKAPILDFSFADINGDGRMDLVLPYSDNNLLAFSISENAGDGFLDYRTQETNVPWSDEARYIALDLIGNGRTDVVQIAETAGKVTFRTFLAIDQGNQAMLVESKQSTVESSATATLQWLTTDTLRNGAKCLVQVWQQPSGDGSSISLNVTTYVYAASSGFRALQSTGLGEYSSKDIGKVTVLPLDLNGDGMQDIVTCYLDSEPGTSSIELTFTFTTFLSNGLGGFTLLGSPDTRQYSAPPDCVLLGNFQTTNLFGSNCTDFAYMYELQNTGALMCFAASGTCTGRFGPLQTFLVAKDRNVSLSKPQLGSVDLNGSSKGGLIAYSRQATGFTVYPIYNQAEIPDFLSSVRDPMGLMTSISYTTLATPTIYDPGVDWSDYTKKTTDVNYPMFGGGMHVVSEYSMVNDPSCNALPYNCNITKFYSGATIASDGRGLQGFQTVVTQNTPANTQTREQYNLEWPLTGMRSELSTFQLSSNGQQLDVGSDAGAIRLQTQSNTYESSFELWNNVWKIYHIDRTQAETMLFDNDQSLARHYGTTFGYDTSGNLILESPWEAAVGLNQSEQRLWKTYAYTALGQVSLPSAKKTSSSSSTNTNMSTFEIGDLALTVCDYDTTTYLMKTISEWSDDTQSFAATTFDWDPYGNEVQRTDAALLTSAKQFDSLCQSFPIKTTQTSVGNSIQLSSYSAFDILTGKESVNQARNGEIKAVLYDNFGRATTRRTNVPADDPSASVQSASTFLAGVVLVADDDFMSGFTSVLLAPCEDVSYQTTSIGTSSSYVSKITKTVAGDGILETTQKCEVIDCRGQVRRKWTTKGSGERFLQWFEYDYQGNCIFESLPTLIPAAVSDDDLFTWSPTNPLGTVSTFDSLRRPLTVARPDHNGVASSTQLTYQYDRGGALTTTTLSSASTGSSQVLENRSMTVQYVGGQDQIISSTDSLGLTSTFSYDPLGRLLVATDPGGNTETRAYNTRGEVTLLNNAYQNTSSAPGSYAISRAYDVAGRLIQETNAVGEVIAYTVDAKGRLLRRSGSDSKGSTFAYDANGFENLTAVISTLPGAGASVESRFDYEYDIKGRKSTSTLSLANGDKFTTAYKHDWQDQVVQQDLTDGTAITRSYDSGLLASVSMAGPKGEDWSVTGAYTQYSAFNTPGQLTVDGSDIMTASLTYSFDYDSLGFPSSRGINNSTQTLAKYLYTYNEQDLLVKRSEDVSGDEIAYEYAGRRLQSSYTSSGTQSTYTHDASGNLEVKAGITFSKKLESLIGTQNGSQVIEVQYDGAGRMSTRSTSEANLTFVYDSLGNMSAIQNATTGHRSQFSQDHIGRTLVRNLPDGSTEVLAGGGLTVKISPNGQRLMQRKLVGNQSTICIVSTLYNAASNSAVTSPNTGSIAVYFADTKDNVTHVFQGDGNLTQQLKYDDFGLCTSTSQDQPLQTYEGRRKDVLSGLLDFGSRWYDPVIGRFAIPDNILSTKPFLMQDGMNRYVFENNDPINHVDPTGHWSWSSIIAIVVCVVAVIAVVVSGGALGAIGAAAIMGAATSGLGYAASHFNDSGSTFWLGFAQSAAIGAAVGAATGMAGEWMEGASMTAKIASASRTVASFVKLGDSEAFVSALAKLMTSGGKALIGTMGDIVNTIDSNAVDDELYGAHQSLLSNLSPEDLGEDFVQNYAMGVGEDWWEAEGKDRFLTPLKDKIKGKISKAFGADLVESNLKWDPIEYDRAFSGSDIRSFPGVEMTPLNAFDRFANP